MICKYELKPDIQNTAAGHGPSSARTLAYVHMYTRTYTRLCTHYNTERGAAPHTVAVPRVCLSMRRGTHGTGAAPDMDTVITGVPWGAGRGRRLTGRRVAGRGGGPRTRAGR